MQKKQQHNQIPCNPILAIIGLGNPGPRFDNTRHNIGFAVLDALAQQEHTTWSQKDLFAYATYLYNNQKILLIKPLTFMNLSGKVMPFLHKQGIKQHNVLVVHDDIDIPFGQIKLKFDGSARGHNGLKSIIDHGGANFYRLRIGVDRPAHKAQVPDYVLQKFSQPPHEIDGQIQESLCVLENLLQSCNQS